MLQYIENIIVPYVEAVRENIDDEDIALVITDNFKGQVTFKVNDLEETRIHVCTSKKFNSFTVSLYIQYHAFILSFILFT